MNVFVIDDSEIARKMLIRMITEDSDVNVIGEAGSGLAGVMSLQEAQADVVMLEADISGNLNAEEVVKEIRNISKDMKIVLCIDDTTNNMVIPMYELGIEQFISKPYSKHKVLPVIRSLKSQSVR